MARSKLALCSLAIAVIVPALPRPAYSQGDWQQTEFVIGAYSDPQLGADYLKQFKEARFNTLTGTVFHTNDQGTRTAYLTLASQLGFNTFVTDGRFTHVGNPLPALQCPTDAASTLATYDTGVLTPAQNGALSGYNLWEEPTWDQSNADYLKCWAEAMHTDDAARAVFLNFTPAGLSVENIERFAHDLDAAKRIDVASVDLYPFFREPSDPTYNNEAYFGKMAAMRNAMGADSPTSRPRPFWVISWAGARDGVDEVQPPPPGGNTHHSDPDEGQLRYMAFSPVAAGAKGILWFMYKETENYDEGKPLVTRGHIATCKYARITRINHYLHDVIGPIVMGSDHIGLWHQSTLPSGETELPLVPGTVDCPVSNLSNDNFMVGVFKPTANPNDRYLLIVNKALSTQSGIVYLKNNWTITVAPSVVNYVGGNDYTPLEVGSNMFVASMLSAGEGRLFRLTPTPTQDFSITSIVGAQWTAGTYKTVTWNYMGTPANMKMYADEDQDAAEITGPSQLLAVNVTGGSFALGMPTNIITNHGRLVVSSVGSDGIERRVNTLPFSTVPAPDPVDNYSSFGTGRCRMDASFVLDGSGNPRLAYSDGDASPNTRNLKFLSYSGSWSPPTTVEPQPGAPPFLGWFGLNPSMTIDSHGRTHLAYYGTNPWIPSKSNFYELHWSVQGTSGQWASPTAIYPAAELGECAMSSDANGDVYLAVTKSSSVHASRNRQDSITPGWQVFGDMITATRPRSLQAVLEGSNKLWVAFIDDGPTTQRLHVYLLEPGTATQMLVMEGAFERVSMTRDAAGHPCIAYALGVGMNAGHAIYYRSYSGTYWSSIETVDNSIQNVHGLSLALNAGVPAVAYAANGVIKYAGQNQNSTWTVHVVDSGEADEPVKLAFAPDASRWVSWFDRTSDQVKIVHGPTPSGGGGGGGNCGPQGCLEEARMQSPNPLVSGGAISLDLRLPHPARVRMDLYDIAGRKAAVFGERELSSGRQALRWQPNGLKAGVYMLRVATESGVLLTKRIVMVR